MNWESLAEGLGFVNPNRPNKGVLIKKKPPKGAVPKGGSSALGADQGGLQ